MVDFFTKEDGDRIVEAIKLAEKQTSGEIRVHLEVNCRKKTMEDAVAIFDRLGMRNTKDRNGVLFLIVPERRELAIYGDVGIHDATHDGYWAEIMDHVQARFREGARAEGICEGVTMVGEKLKKHFPYQSDDINELPDEISYG